MALRVLISGADGFVGTPLTAAFRARGDQVRRLTRSRAGLDSVHWDPAAGELDPAQLEGFDAVVHLAGETVNGIWSKSKKAKILQSRRDGTRLLAHALAGCERRPECLVSASAIGYYGSSGDRLLTEDMPRGDGFMADVVEAWEGAAEPARAAGIRVANLRLGLVLAARGGAMDPLRLSFGLGVGGRLGSGRHWWSWVTLDDVVRAFIHAVDSHQVEGVYNVATANPVTNAEFTKTLASVMHRPAVLPVPRFALRLFTGAMADELLLASQRIDPTKLRSTGFEFSDPELRAGLERLLA